jgi:hypothetical protein
LKSIPKGRGVKATTSALLSESDVGNMGEAPVGFPLFPERLKMRRRPQRENPIQTTVRNEKGRMSPLHLTEAKAVPVLLKLAGFVGMIQSPTS